MTGSFHESGVIADMVGARFKKEGFIEWHDCVVTHDQNTRQNGYGPPGKLQLQWTRLKFRCHCGRPQRLARPSWIQGGHGDAAQSVGIHYLDGCRLICDLIEVFIRVKRLAGRAWI